MALLSKSATKNCSSSPARMTRGGTQLRKVIREKRKSTDNRQAVFGHHKSFNRPTSRGKVKYITTAAGKGVEVGLMRKKRT
ncbi:hypothetical protein QTP88_024610 [Uroleucon formosanum]